MTGLQGVKVAFTTLQSEDFPDDGLKRMLMSRNAFEQRHDDPAKDYGIGGVTLDFALVGEKGAVDWELLTGLFLPHVMDRFRGSGDFRPMATAGPVTFHYPEEQEAASGPHDCGLTGKPCWTDLSYMMGERPYEALTKGGLPGVYEWLVGMYEAEFK